MWRNLGDLNWDGQAVSSPAWAGRAQAAVAYEGIIQWMAESCALPCVSWWFLVSSVCFFQGNRQS